MGTANLKFTSISPHFCGTGAVVVLFLVSAEAWVHPRVQMLIVAFTRLAIKINRCSGDVACLPTFGVCLLVFCKDFQESVCFCAYKKTAVLVLHCGVGLHRAFRVVCILGFCMGL